jgi:hypothetical protein
MQPNNWLDALLAEIEQLVKDAYLEGVADADWFHTCSDERPDWEVSGAKAAMKRLRNDT